jgi:8-oxo-dGTP diphosphatase
MDDIVTKYSMRTGNNWGTGIILINKEGKTLVGLRTDTKTWATPGGKVNVGETILEGIIRETKEETNLKISKPEYIDVVVSAFNNDKVWLSFLFIKKDVKGEVKPQISEFSELKWVSLSELRKMELFEPTKMLVDELTKRKLI